MNDVIILIELKVIRISCEVIALNHFRKMKAWCFVVNEVLFLIYFETFFSEVAAELTCRTILERNWNVYRLVASFHIYIHRYTKDFTVSYRWV